MKETPISTCEKTFLLEALWEGKRLDGRSCQDTRDVVITYGLDWGSVEVTLGKTRVMAQVSCSVVEPMFTRPNEGILHVNLELTPLAAPRFDAGRQSDEGVELSRLLERTLKESRCLDLESLCIVAEEKVWQIRLDIHALNHEGNLFDASSIAGLCALCHFRRPDVTLKGDVVTVHPLSERDPVPLGIHHHPVTTTFGMFEYQNGTTLTVSDPTRVEEEAMMGKLVLGVNGYREVCTLHLAGQILVDKSQVVRLANLAAEKSKKMVDKIKSSLSQDEETRKNKGPRGFSAKNRQNSILTNSAPRSTFDFTRVTPLAKAVVSKSKKSTEKIATIKGAADSDMVDVLPEGVDVDDSSEEGEEEEEDEEEDSSVKMESDSDCEVTAVKSRKEILKEKIKEHIDLDDSEEEETVTLGGTM